MPMADYTGPAIPTSRDMPSHWFVKYAARLARVDEAAVAFMEAVRAAEAFLREEHGYTLSSFAGCTGLHRNSMLKLKDQEWMPEPETMWRLDGLITRAAAKRRGEVFPGETLKRGRPSKTGRATTGCPNQ
jgi:hypothetical protein